MSSWRKAELQRKAQKRVQEDPEMELETEIRKTLAIMVPSDF